MIICTKSYIIFEKPLNNFILLNLFEATRSYYIFCRFSSFYIT